MTKFELTIPPFFSSSSSSSDVDVILTSMVNKSPTGIDVDVGNVEMISVTFDDMERDDKSCIPS